MNNKQERLSLLVDYIALVYHEARNVRHLVKGHTVEHEQWKYLVALPVNKHKAWEELHSTRLEAKNAETVRNALLPFERRFQVELEELQALYGHPAWRNSACGGNAWKKITELVQLLSAALQEGQWEEADRLLSALADARHNTGLVAAKLHLLDAAMQQDGLDLTASRKRRSDSLLDS